MMMAWIMSVEIVNNKADLSQTCVTQPMLHSPVSSQDLRMRPGPGSASTALSSSNIRLWLDQISYSAPDWSENPGLRVIREGGEADLVSEQQLSVQHSPHPTIISIFWGTIIKRHHAWDRPHPGWPVRKSDRSQGNILTFYWWVKLRVRFFKLRKRRGSNPCL